MTYKCTHKLPYHLVLDLDSTLIFSTEGPLPDFKTLGYPSRETANRIRTFHIGDDPIWFIMRPYTPEFLRWAGRTFKSVIIWSAGSPEYVRKIAGELGKYCYFAAVLTRDQCVAHKGAYTKPLANLPRLVPHLNINVEDVFIIDDKDYTFDFNPGQGIVIPPYEPSLSKIIGEKQDSRDKALLVIIHFFCHKDAYALIALKITAAELFRQVEVDFEYTPVVEA